MFGRICLEACFLHDFGFINVEPFSQIWSYFNYGRGVSDGMSSSKLVRGHGGSWVLRRSRVDASTFQSTFDDKTQVF